MLSTLHFRHTLYVIFPNEWPLYIITPTSKKGAKSRILGSRLHGCFTTDLSSETHLPTIIHHPCLQLRNMVWFVVCIWNSIRNWDRLMSSWYRYSIFLDRTNMNHIWHHMADICLILFWTFRKLSSLRDIFTACTSKEAPPYVSPASPSRLTTCSGKSTKGSEPWKTRGNSASDIIWLLSFVCDLGSTS